MASKYEIRDQLDKTIKSLALSKVDRFYPSAIAKILNISSQEAFSYLLDRIDEGDQLELLWELRCPLCCRTLKISTAKQIPNEIECICGNEINLQPSDFFPVFRINKKYKDYLANEQKKTKILIRQPTTSKWIQI